MRDILEPLDISFINRSSTQIRLDILDAVYASQSGHITSSYSALDLCHVLFYYFLKFDPESFAAENHDFFVLSKGHASPLLYALLANKGFYSQDWKEHLREVGYPYQGHPNAHLMPEVHISTGSLGQGFSAAAGMALGLKLDNKLDRKVFVLVGDGELQEGVVWETAMSSNHYQLSNLYTIVDVNELQIDGSTKNIMSIEPIREKWESFGWDVYVLENGHDVQAIYSLFELLLYHSDSLDSSKQNKPKVILAHTKKGKGVSFMEDNYQWHGKAPNEEMYLKAKEELKKQL